MESTSMKENTNSPVCSARCRLATKENRLNALAVTFISNSNPCVYDHVFECSSTNDRPIADRCAEIGYFSLLFALPR